MFDLAAAVAVQSLAVAVAVRSLAVAAAARPPAALVVENWLAQNRFDLQFDLDRFALDRPVPEHLDLVLDQPVRFDIVVVRRP